MAAGETLSQPHKDKLMRFARNMRLRRVELGHTPGHCALIAGMDRANWLRIERGRTRSGARGLSLGTALRVADALCTTVGKLLNEGP